jgi:hypothetical protein
MKDTNAAWIHLFDGNSMNQWRSYNGTGTNGWEIRGDEMVALGRNPSNDLITKEQFENFELSLEWAISEGGNSGIFFNVVEGPAYAAVYHTGPEYQLLDEDGYPTVADWQRTGANYAMHTASNNKTKPRGQFNTSKIIVNKGHVEHWLNGQLVVSYDLWTPEWEQLKMAGKWKDYPAYGMAKKGHLAIQDHGNEVRFRNIKVRRL